MKNHWCAVEQDFPWSLSISIVQVEILHHLLSQRTLEFGLPLQASSAHEFSFSLWFSRCCKIHLEPQLLAKASSFFAFFCLGSVLWSPLGYFLLQHNHWSQSLILGDMWNIFPFCSFKWQILGTSFRSFLLQILRYKVLLLPKGVDPLVHRELFL